MIFIISQKIALEKMSVAVKRSCANFLQIVLFEHKHVIVYKKKHLQVTFYLLDQVSFLWITGLLTTLKEKKRNVIFSTELSVDKCTLLLAAMIGKNTVMGHVLSRK